MLQLNIQSDDFKRACNRARVFHNRVSRAGERLYRVRSGNSNEGYVVRFALGQANEKLAGCSCAAGQRDLLCHHVASALTVHIAIRQMQQQSAA